MKTLFKWFTWICTAAVLFVMCDVLLEDEEGTTEYAEEEVIDDDEEYEEEDEESVPVKPASNKADKPASTAKTDKPATTTKTDKPATTAKRKVTTITGADYKSKLADYSASTTAGKKGVNAVVLVYLPTDDKCNQMLESMSTLANEFPKLDLYAIKFQEGVDLAKAYGLKELPQLIVVRNGKVELHKGYLQTESLRSFLQKY